MAALIIDRPMDDTQVEVVLAQLEEHDAVVIRHHDLGGAVVQALLCASARMPVSIEAEAPTLRQLFENPQVAQD
ncbi:hypothetical protein [Sulfurivirga sp.]|uniref:hypothetical protein n=1 Tax=Sulfurivirga sp. TaxID=2614236 RepID=UPI0025D53685|nr:hypothetical protein [Sulfurivirga sp.]